MNACSVQHYESHIIKIDLTYGDTETMIGWVKEVLWMRILTNILNSVDNKHNIECAIW